MSRVDEQSRFTQDVGRLIAKAYELGYVLTFGETYRTPVQAWINSQPYNSHLECIRSDGTIEPFADTIGGIGISKSLHLERLAVDFNIFKNGVLLSKKEDIQPLGEYWESLDTHNRWGGFFKTRMDAPHFERNV